jgi:hypothetical protein
VPAFSRAVRTSAQAMPMNGSASDAHTSDAPGSLPSEMPGRLPEQTAAADHQANACRKSADKGHGRRPAHRLAAKSSGRQ